uniref:phosphate ABC transporter substrate-binding protein n=1 Tax=Collinsella sp. BA40 TaxID=2560852 RepID=UPI002106D313|nr:phosphate ABC transporter substrate-binding protein [Collinsella sp. BA40]
MRNSRLAAFDRASQHPVLLVPGRGGHLWSSRRHSRGPLALIAAGALSFVTAVSISACSTTVSTGSITVAGSTTCLPIAEVAAESYTEQTGVSVLVSGLGSSAGIEAVSNDTADIATSSRGLNAQEQDLGLTTIPIAHDGIAVIVNPDNPVQNLSVDQLRAIYAGEVTNWSEVGGEDLPIQLVNRDEASGTREAFKSIIMDGAPFDRRAAVLSGTGQVRDVVSRTRGAIGYISMGFVESKYAQTQVRAISVNHVEPSEKTVASGGYPISRDLYFFTKGEPSDEAQGYIEYVLSDEMDDQIREAGFIPVSNDAGEGM